MKAGGGRNVSIINPRKSPTTCFQCHTEVRAAFELPHHHPVLEGKVSCADCHNPHKGDAVKGGGTNLPQARARAALLATKPASNATPSAPFVFET